MALSLSTSWNAARHREGEPMLQEIRDLGFAQVELSHNIRFSLYPGIVAAVDRGILAVSSLHNFCPVPPDVLRPSPNCFEFSSDRAEDRKRAVRSTLETLDFALRVKAPAVVLHLGWAGPKGITARLEKAWVKGQFLSRSYVQAKVEAVAKRRKLFAGVYARVRSCLDEIVPAAQERGLKLGFEIRENYAEFPDEVEMERLLTDFPAETVGYWHDFGHAAAKDFLGWHDHAATLERRIAAGQLLGCHIHDCAPPAKDHLPLGMGGIDFATLASQIPAEAIQVLELSPRVDRADVIKSSTLWQAMNAWQLSAAPSASYSAS